MERYLKILNSYERMPPELEQAYRDNVNPINVRKHDIIQEAGTTTDNIYFVEKGLFRLYANHKGKDVTRQFKTEDAFIVVAKELCQGREYNDGIEALEDSILWRIPGSLIAELKRKFFPFLVHCSFIIEMERLRLKAARKCSRQDGGSKNYMALRKYAPTLLNRVPIPYLANYTAMPERNFRHLHLSEIKLNSLAGRRKL